MKRITHSVVTLSVLSVFGFAQSGDLKSFEPLIGTFTGSGAVHMAQGAEGMPWTAVQTSQWIANKQFIQADMRVDMGAPAPLAFRTVYGWNADLGKPVGMGISNQGLGGEETVHWIDAKTMVGVSSGIDPESGLPYAERSISTFNDTGYEINIERSTGTSPFFTYVTGSFEKKGDAISVQDLPGFMPASDHMTRMNKIAGTYDVGGKMLAAPGADLSPVEAMIELKPIFDGSVLASHFKIEGGYEGWGYTYWDPAKKSYVYYTINGMGTHSVQEARWTSDNQLVFTASIPMEGIPGIQRTVVNLGDSGVSHVTVDRMHAGNPAVLVYDGKYTRRAEAEAEAVEAKAEKASLSFKPGSCCDKADKAGGTCKHPCCVEALAKGEVCAGCNS